MSFGLMVVLNVIYVSAVDFVSASLQHEYLLMISDVGENVSVSAR
jgi:hypothetical protein